MKTKISMKTIYLILVITIGLVGLGVGSTLAVFTASAEITNPISFSSNLSYNGDVFDTVEVTIGPNSSQNVNFTVYNNEKLTNVKYAAWYIYDGDDSDIAFKINFNESTSSNPSGVLNTTTNNILEIKVFNFTANTITLTIGVATSKDDIVLPSYMELISDTSTVTLTSSKLPYTVPTDSTCTFSLTSSTYGSMSCVLDVAASKKISYSNQSILVDDEVVGFIDDLCDQVNHFGDFSGFSKMVVNYK